MTNLINKILARFQLKLVSTKPVSLVDETVKFLKNHKDYWNDDVFSPPYVGDVVFVKDKITGQPYFRQSGTEEKYFCDYDGDPNVSFNQMYEETTFTAEEMREKLTN